MPDTVHDGVVEERRVSVEPDFLIAIGFQLRLNASQVRSVRQLLFPLVISHGAHVSVPNGSVLHFAPSQFPRSQVAVTVTLLNSTRLWYK